MYILRTSDGQVIECKSNPDGSFEVIVPVDDSGQETIEIAGSMDVNGRMEVMINGVKRMALTGLVREDQLNRCIHLYMWPDRPIRNGRYTFDMVFDHPLLPQHSSSIIAGAAHGVVKAPMPGKLTRIQLQNGDTVKEEDVVMVMEAMKMEHTIRAPRDGILSDMNRHVNEVIQEGAPLFSVVGKDELIDDYSSGTA
jgi:3-methylcrotonyl-CoA carboxylase alpha subunit